MNRRHPRPPKLRPIPGAFGYNRHRPEPVAPPVLTAPPPDAAHLVLLKRALVRAAIRKHLGLS
jgi:hypothetical protein